VRTRWRSRREQHRSAENKARRLDPVGLAIRGASQEVVEYEIASHAATEHDEW